MTRRLRTWLLTLGLFLSVLVVADDSFAAARPVGCTTPPGSFTDAPVHDDRVSITYDESLTYGQMPKLLNTFAAYEMHGTFFQVGNEVEQKPILANRIVDEGHELANHSYSHEHLTQVPSWDEIRLGRQAIKQTTGFTPCDFRPPYGDVNQRVIDQAESLDETTVMWSYGVGDIYMMDPEAIADRQLRAIDSGATIVLLHQTPWSADALPLILQGLQERGLRSVPVLKLLGGSWVRPATLKAKGRG